MASRFAVARIVAVPSGPESLGPARVELSEPSDNVHPVAADLDIPSTLLSFSSALTSRDDATGSDRTRGVIIRNWGRLQPFAFHNLDLSNQVHVHGVHLGENVSDGAITEDVVPVATVANYETSATAEVVTRPSEPSMARAAGDVGWPDARLIKTGQAVLVESLRPTSMAHAPIRAVTAQMDMPIASDVFQPAYRIGTIPGQAIDQLTPASRVAASIEYLSAVPATIIATAHQHTAGVDKTPQPEIAGLLSSNLILDWSQQGTERITRATQPMAWSNIYWYTQRVITSALCVLGAMTVYTWRGRPQPVLLPNLLIKRRGRV